LNRATEYTFTVYLEFENNVPSRPYIVEQKYVTEGVKGIPTQPRNFRGTDKGSALVELTWDSPIDNGGAVINYYVIS
jgi:hypothetical protein